MLLQKNRPSKHVTVHARWCRVIPLSAVTEWSRLQSSECRDQTQIIMHCACQHYYTVVRLKVCEDSGWTYISAWNPLFTNSTFSKPCKFEMRLPFPWISARNIRSTHSPSPHPFVSHADFEEREPDHTRLVLYFTTLLQHSPLFHLTPRLFHRLKIRRFSCSLAELFLAPPHSCSVSGI